MMNSAARFNKAQVIWKHYWTPKLFSIRVALEQSFTFLPGQYVRTAFIRDEKLVVRPYSIVNVPGQKEIELYVVVTEDVEHVTMSSYLAQLKTGDQLLVDDHQAYGYLTLEEVPADDSLWLLASGAGLAPFLSMIRAGKMFDRFSYVYLAHSARFVNELGYADELADLQRRYKHFSYLPFVTRETADSIFTGRITDAINTGFLEEITKRQIDTDCQFMICGNPGLIDGCTSALRERGLERNRRRKPGQITVEKFW